MIIGNIICEDDKLQIEMPKNIRKLACDDSRRLQWIREKSSIIYKKYCGGEIDAKTAIQKQDELLRCAGGWLW